MPPAREKKKATFFFSIHSLVKRKTRNIESNRM